LYFIFYISIFFEVFKQRDIELLMLHNVKFDHLSRNKLNLVVHWCFVCNLSLLSEETSILLQVAVNISFISVSLFYKIVLLSYQNFVTNLLV